MNFSVLPPEINSMRIFAGAGPTPMLEAAAAWDGVAGELASSAALFNSMTSGLAAASWQGAASQAMMAAAGSYLACLNAVTAEAGQAATQARTMASAFEVVRAATVHPGLVAANRDGLLSLVRTNLFGFNTPAIAAAEAEYEQMWAADVAAMFDYHAEAAAALSQLTPFTQPLQNLAGLAAQLAGGTSSPAAAVPAATVRTLELNLGVANVGSGNLGMGNVGSGNFGNGNFGICNVGSGNFGNFNIGLGNLGSSNFGFGNAGSFNRGFANAGSRQPWVRQHGQQQHRHRPHGGQPDRHPAELGHEQYRPVQLGQRECRLLQFG